MRCSAFAVALFLAFSSAAQELPELTPEGRAEALRERRVREARREREARVEVLPESAVCANGDFEDGLLSTVWGGEEGWVRVFTGELDLDEAPLRGGPLCSIDSHQTVVGAGIDPSVFISTVAPGSTKAVRLGNAEGRAGAEALVKKFRSPGSVIAFSYALVFQDPEHFVFQQPNFEVKVFVNGVERSGLADLGNGKSKLIADRGDPFFTPLGPPSVTLYRDWTCASIDLRGTSADDEVRVELITADCARGGHFTYAYIDDFCGGGACGPLLEPARSPEHRPECEPCGEGEICFDYGVPGGGSGEIHLEIRQGDIVKKTLTNAVSGSGTSCFAITRELLGTLAEGRFDYIATATFAAARSVGGEYRTACGTPGCCAGFNAIVNGDFEADGVGFDTDYGSGEIAVLDAAQAEAFAPTWKICDGAGKALFVNGSTCGRKRLVWAQTAPVMGGALYRFCASLRNLPQCAFDVKPLVELRCTPGLDAIPSLVDVVTGCEQSESHELRVPTDATSVRCEIWLDESRAGDGNDLAVDTISLQRVLGGTPPPVERTAEQNECVPPSGNQP